MLEGGHTMRSCGARNGPPGVDRKLPPRATGLKKQGPPGGPKIGTTSCGHTSLGYKKRPPIF